jgi:hypothetical protein
MEYATLNPPSHGYPDQLDRPYFSRLSDIEGELARSADLIEEFIARCRGGGMAGNTKSPVPAASGHFAALDRVIEQMTRIDKLSRELGTIG